ncbi:DedA family protein, partial [Patescibacteria group bacterium]
RWFARYGEKTVFLARFVPVVRHLISIPCGLARMRYGKFLFFTAAGGFLWNTFLLWLGVKMGEQWGIIRAWGRTADIIFVGALVAGVLLFIRHRRADRAALARRRAD